MAITNFIVLNPADKTKIRLETAGTGAPASTDVLVTKVSEYQLLSTYYDYANYILYTRVATNGVTADFAKTAAGTLSS